MSDMHMDWPPPRPWASDWTFCISGWYSRHAPDLAGSFRTLAKPGDLAPLIFPAPWSFHAALPEHDGPPHVVFLANGYRLSFPRKPEAGTFTCLMTEPGIMVGRSGVRMSPSLFSAEFEVRRSGDTEWIDLPDGFVLLARKQSASEIRFCLATGTGDRAGAVDSAVDRMEEDPDSGFDAEAARRSPFWGEHPMAPCANLSYAVESLIARVRPPCGAFAFRWSVGGRIDGSIFDINQALALGLAWRSIDCTVAEDIVRCALSCQLEDGTIPAQVSVDGTTPFAAPAWPLLAQSAVVAWSGRRDPAFLDFVLPRLYRYLASLISHTDPQTRGVPCWQSSRESLVPETFDAGLASPDLTAFLICEIEAFIELSEAAPRFTFDRPALATEHDRLAKYLVESFWDPASRTFRSHYADGKPIERISIASILPLLWSDLPARFEEPLLRQLGGDAQFHTKYGAPLWLKWEDELEMPPCPAAHQILVLEALHRAGARQELQRFARTLSHRLDRHFSSESHLPDDLRPASDSVLMNPERAFLRAQGAVPSALAVVLADAIQEHEGPAGASSAKLRWLDRHRTAVIASAVGILSLVVVGVAAALIARRTLPGASAAALAGLARQQSSEGYYDTAISNYQTLFKGTRGSPAVELLMGNTYFEKGDFAAAEACYRNVIRKDPQSPIALYNLALTLFRQDRLDEATACYNELIQKFGPLNPSLAGRARTALDLIAERAGHSL